MTDARPGPRRLTALAAALTFLGAASSLRAADPSFAFYRGKLAFEEGRWKAAGKSFAEAGRKGYAKDEIHYWMGQCYRKMGKNDRARHHLRKARDAGLKSNELTLELAWIASEAGDAEAAASELDRLPLSYKGRPEYNLLMGNALLKRSEFDQAFDYLVRAAHHYPYKVHSASGYFLNEKRKRLQDITKARIAALEEGDPSWKVADTKLSSLKDTTRPVEALPRSPPGQVVVPRGMTSFGSKFANTPKAGGQAYKLHRGSQRGKGGGKGPVTLSRPSYGSTNIK